MALHLLFAFTVVSRSVDADAELKDDYVLDGLTDVFSPPVSLDGMGSFDDILPDGLSTTPRRGTAVCEQIPFPTYYFPDPAFVEPPQVAVNNWAGVKGWEACGGRQQSPIEVDVESAMNNTSEVEFTGNYDDRKVNKGWFSNNGHNVALSFEGGAGKLRVKKAGGGVKEGTYDLAQFHFHSPSEHRLVKGGVNVYTPLEMHMVHVLKKKKDKSHRVAQREKVDGYAVISIMFEVNDTKAIKDGKDGGYKFLQQIEVDVGTMYKYKKTGKKLTLDWKLLKIPESSFFYYVGSLTTPPCTENVAWFILSEPRYITSAMHKSFVSGINIVGGNNRPPNPLNGRKVSYVKV